MDKMEANKLYRKRYYQKNKEKIKKHQKDRRKKDPERTKLLDKKYQENRLKDPIKKKKFYAAIRKWQQSTAGKLAISKYQKEYYKKIIDGKLTVGQLQSIRNKEDRKKNPQKFKLRDKKHRVEKMKNPIKASQRRNTMNAWMKMKRQTDPYYKIRYALSASLAQFLKREGSKKAGSITKLIGCTKEELKLHLEKKFYPHPITGEMMNWKNHARRGWHVDHIKPLNAFKNQDLNNIEVQKEIMHYTNLQPLWAEDNIKKGDNF